MANLFSKFPNRLDFCWEGAVEGDVTLNKNDQFRLSIIEDFRSGRVSRADAARVLNTSERTVTRLAKKIRGHGAAGIVHGNRSRSPWNKIDSTKKVTVQDLIRSDYYDFNVMHTCEVLKERNQITVSYRTLLRWCHEISLVKHVRRKNRTSKQRVFRERMTNEGLLLQMDGSHHEWIPGERWCLIAMIDDATSQIPHAQFFKTESTNNCLEVLENVCLSKGIPQALYVDKAGWFGGTKRYNFSQFEKVCRDLGSNVIFANSPEAKGRIERAWKTFQDRLIPEMRLHNIKSIDEANVYLATVFLPFYWNKRNTVAAASSENRYKQLPEKLNIIDTFCCKEYRHIRRDRTFWYDNKLFKIKCDLGGGLTGMPRLTNPKGAIVKIHRYRDETWAAFFYHQRLEIIEIKLPNKFHVLPKAS